MKASKEILSQELALAKLIASGDHTAFEELYHKTHQRVYGICYRITKDAELSEDLCQQAYIQIWKKIGEFQGKSRLSTWIHRIAVNEALMHFRKAYVRKESAFPETESGEVPFKTANRYTPRSNEDLKIDLERAIKQLPKGYFQVFLLKEIQGLDHSEVAQYLRKTEGNSKSQLSKAKKKMIHLLNKQANPRILSMLTDELA